MRTAVWPDVPLTPRLLLDHADSRHGALAMTPWALLSALGLVTLVESSSRMVRAKMAIAGLLLVGAVWHGARFVASYFRDYPILAAPYFQYGIEQTLQAIKAIDDGREPIVVSTKINQPYIYVLFHERYPPRKFQNENVTWLPGMFPQVVAFDRYFFIRPDYAYRNSDRGIFIFPGNVEIPAPAAVSIPYPDGSIAYRVVVKRPSS
jgi:hypothetical protein